MSFIPQKILNQTPYEPNSGVFDIRMDANESPFDLSPELKREFIQLFMDTPVNRYPDPCAVELRQAFAQRYEVCADRVVAANGSDELLSIIISSFLSEGEGIAVRAPDFSMYSFYAEMAGAKINVYKGDSLDGFLDFIVSSGSRLCAFSNPNNPTGAGFEREAVLSFVESCPCLCVVDEAYMDFWDQSILDRAGSYENLIVLRTLSKAFGLAGLRLGFAVTTSELTRAINVVRSPYNVNSVSQLLGVLALSKGENKGAYLAQQAQLLISSLREALPEAVVSETHTNFVTLKTPRAKLIFDTLVSKRIAIRIFGSDTLRITASTPEETAKLLAAIKEV